MGQGSTAYASYLRIHEEMGCPTLPDWQALPHVGRMAWEAAAQAVARSILPASLGSQPTRAEIYDDEGDDDNGSSQQDGEDFNIDID